MKHITINLGADKIELDMEVHDNASVTSNMHINEGDEDYEAEYRDSYNGFVDALESVAMAHAVAGINVESESYAEGFRTALEGFCNANC